MELMIKVNEKHLDSLRSIGVDPERAINLILTSLNYHILKESQGYDVFKDQDMEQLIKDLIRSCRTLKKEQVIAANKGSLAIEDLKNRREGEDGKFKKKK